MSIAQYLTKFALGITPEGLLSPAKGGTGSTTGGGNSPTITAIAYIGNDTATDTAGGSIVTLTGTNFNVGVTVLVGNTQVSQVTRISATQLTFLAPANAAGSYILYVVNTDGGTALSVPGIQYSGVPSWTTVSGSLGNVYTFASFTSTLAATGDAPISYLVTSGALPAGVNLNTSTGVISGTIPSVVSSTTYNFTVRATDAQNQDTDRVFSLTVLPVTYSVTPAANNINEGSALTLNVTGDGIANGTYYWTVNTNAGDFGTSSGSFTITSNVGSFTVTPTADVTTEGSETFTVSIRSGSTSGTVLATTSSITINDASTAPTITPVSSSVNEGSALTFNVYVSGINYAVYYWVINNTTTGAADFSATQGEVTINSGSGSFTITPTADSATEGAETFTVSLRDGPPGAGGWGNVVATSSTITINDTSIAPNVPTVIGQAFGGGYYAGQISTNGNGIATHYLIVADKTVGESLNNVAWGTYGATVNVTSEIDGPTNSATMAALGSNYSAAQFCENLNTGGYTDWYMPARKELASIYCQLKPTTGDNAGDYGYATAQIEATGVNSWSIPKRTTGYSSVGNPSQTTATNFRSGASSQEFSSAWYWVSTSYTADNRGAWAIYFVSGAESPALSKNGGNSVRAVRRIPV
jgi:hypothetical protein